MRDLFKPWLQGFVRAGIGDLLVPASSPDVPAPAGCSVTLTTDDIGPFGWQPASIDGQRVYITNSGADAIYGASTDQQSPTPIWTGTRFIEGQDVVPNTVDSPVKTALLLTSPDGAKYFQARQRANDGSWDFLTSAGSLIVNQGAAGSVVAIGINGTTGDLKAYVVGIGEVALGAGAVGFWGTESVCIAANVDTAGIGQDGSITVVTDGGSYLSGAVGDDWCGSPIP